MNKKFFLIFLVIIFLQSCSDKFVSVVSTGNPEIITDKREVVDVEGYKLKKQDKFDFSLEKNELVQYQTKIPEKQKWKEFKEEAGYALLTVPATAIAASISINPDGETEQEIKETKNFGIGMTAILGTISLYLIIRSIIGKEYYTKTVYTPGQPIERNEWNAASNELIKVSYNDQYKNYSTDFSGQLTINPNNYDFPVLTEHRDFQLSFSKGEFQNFATANIHSSWWMKEYGIINKDPVSLLGDLNSSPFFRNGLLGYGSTIDDKKQVRYLLKLSMDAWIQPQDLNVFYYSSPRKIGNIPSLKTINYNTSGQEIIRQQKEILEHEVNR